LIRDRFDSEHAETMALEGLAFLAGRPDDLDRFLGNSGLDATELRRRAGDRDVLRAVIEFLLAEDTLVTTFCDERGLDPRELHRANHLLGGA
jgi:hypothetical protein